ncbi:MAG TPA: glycoside hydrolase family 15 protein [Planctomycetaceae bacterium]|jgi:GH15 family glucan-1,4-alpha-glucosidase|nr:glycoside hydrolase family 15 protein [Planctomycetaceae bacterium]
MSYQPIENYGIIGNMRTAALVSMQGSIDWFCFPHFDSPSVFAGILDDLKGGHFSISAAHKDARHKQVYWPDTNVLVTRFLSPNGVGEVQDFMPILGRSAGTANSRLIRRVRVSRGELEFRVVCEPAFDYARATHETVHAKHGVVFRSDRLTLALSSPVRMRCDRRGARGTFRLREGESMVFVLRELVGSESCCQAPDDQESDQLFRETVDYWRKWLSQCQYRGRWRDIVYRAALTLKLLTFEPTGALVAAATCSLPEKIGGPRNWDYRYTWIRDAAFSLYGLLRLGFTSEAADFMGWLDARYREQQGEGMPLGVLYGIDGRCDIPETTLDHLDGYRGSRPVRIGNAAYGQVQLDIFGELFDSVYLFNKYGSPISYDGWKHLRSLLDWLCENWQRPDDGIWEVRGGQHDFVYSRLMCWVAIDRGLRLADKRSFPADRSRWLKVRDEIYEEILTRGWSEERQSFVQSYGSDALDASALIMPLVFFMAPNDPKMLKTIDAICKAPAERGLTSDGLVHRYDVERSPDGVFGEEGTFNMCSFWLVEALTRAGRTDPQRLEQARLLFERMLGHANHLGLYAEETGPSGEALGNFPQAFTHLALISAAFNLDRSLGSGS